LDDSSSLGFAEYASILLVAIIIIRLLNNLVRAGYFGLGRISLLALAEKARESNPRLWRYLDEPHRLNFASLLMDKLLLFLLVFCGYYTVGEPRSSHFLLLLGYLALFDFIIPSVAAAFIPEWLVTRLFPFLQGLYALLNPVTFLAARLSRHAAARENGEEWSGNSGRNSGMIASFLL